MADFIQITFYLAITLAFVLHTVPGRSSLPTEESLELNTELISTPHVKTINTEYGDIYDCVELYKQPAFDHPLLKHHKIQMRPTFSQQKKASENSSSSSLLAFGLKESCPSGTVPIRRTTEEERLLAKAAFTQHFQPSINPPNSNSPLVFAGLSYPGDDKLGKAGGFVSIQNPTVDMQQLSASVISLEHGPPDQFASIRVGWMVYPNLYHGDNRTRLYTLWGQEVGGVAHGCYNTYCPGFIQKNAKIPLDMVLDASAGPHGELSYLALGLLRDTVTGNWWLYFGEAEDPIGYWPPNLFLALKDGAKMVRWGGMVTSPSQKLPDMGNGKTGDDGCHFRKLSEDYALSTSMDLDGSEPRNVPYELLQTNCYKAGDNSYKGSYWGYSFWFGGKGGDVQQCEK